MLNARSRAPSLEIWSQTLFEEPLCTVSYSEKNAKLAVACESQFKILEISQGFSSIQIQTMGTEFSDRIQNVEWTADGQVKIRTGNISLLDKSFLKVISVSTKNGRFMSFMCYLPLVQDVWMNHVLCLTSMMEMEITDTRRTSKATTVKVKVHTKIH